MKKYENLADINAEINNYKSFKENLLEYLECNPIVKYSQFKKKLINCILNVIVILKLIRISKIFTIIGEEVLIFTQKKIFKYNKIKNI